MKLFFRMLFFICLLTSFVFAYAYAYTETHYVTQNGNGAKTGRSLSNAWSVSQFNNSANWSANVAVDGKIGPNDVVYFSGTITTKITPPRGGTSNGYVTLDGFEAGNCDPINNSGNPGAATISGGMEPIGEMSYVTFQDFNITGGVWAPHRSGTPGCNNLKFLRNNWDNARGAHFSAGSIGGKPSYWWFEGNRFNNYSANNDVPGGINFSNVSHLVLRGNYFTGRNGISSSSNKLEFHQCSFVLFEYNNVDCKVNKGNTGALAFKEYGNQNVIIRFNKFVGTSERPLGINWPETTNFYVYGNLFSGNTQYAIDVFDGATNVNIWSNIIENHPNGGLLVWYQPNRQPRYNPDRRVQNLKVYNNTFFNNATIGGAWQDRTALSIGDTAATGVIVKNNLFVNNRPTENDRRQISDRTNGILQESNTYWHFRGAPTVYRSGGDRTISVLQSSYGVETKSPAGEVANPGLKGNLTLDGTYINKGANLSGTAGSITIHGTTYTMYWQTALHPDTDWSGQPSAAKIKTANQNDYAAWQRGAYVFDNDDSIKPPSDDSIKPPSIVTVEPYDKN